MASSTANKAGHLLVCVHSNLNGLWHTWAVGVTQPELELAGQTQFFNETYREKVAYHLGKGNLKRHKFLTNCVSISKRTRHMLVQDLRHQHQGDWRQLGSRSRNCDIHSKAFRISIVAYFCFSNSDEGNGPGS